MTTYTRIDASRGETIAAPAYQKFVNGRYVETVSTVPEGYCGACGARKPAVQSCGCFDNGGQ